MKLESMSPNFMTDHMDEVLDFYVNILGFTKLMGFPEQAPHSWAMLQRDEITLMFQSRASLAAELPVFENAPTDGNLSLYIKVVDIKSWLEQIGPKVKLVKPLTTTFYGANEFVFADPEGRIISFAEDVATA